MGSRLHEHSKKLAATKEPDMLSLSISISIVAKFVMFELAGFLQVNSSVAESMPNLEWPKEFKELSRQVSSVFNLDFMTEIGDANCSLGSNYCYRIMVFMCTLLGFQLAFPAGVALARFLPPLRRRITQERIDTLIDRAYHGNAIIMMVLHPPIGKKVASLLACSWYNDNNVIEAAKTLPCGDTVCVTTGLVFFLLYTVGTPAYVFISLRSYLSPRAKERHKGSPMLARYKARLGFICGKYEADFWYYEILEMTRKTLLMAVASFIQKGSYSQLFAKIVISGFFFGCLVRTTPFNSEKLDLLVTTSHFCTLATLFFALMMKIGFFETEGVPEDVMSSLLMLIMFIPLIVAVYIVGSAIHEAFLTKCVRGGLKLCARLQRLSKKANAILDRQMKGVW